MRHHPIPNTEEDLADYRGSIVDLQPNTTYQVAIDSGTPAGNYTFTATNRAGGSAWSASFILDGSKL
jgi:hypothetical protein